MPGRQLGRLKYFKGSIAWLKEPRSQGWLGLLRALRLWFVAIGFSVMGPCVSCVVIGLIVAAIGIKMAAINKAYWANLPSEEKARIGARRSELVTKSYEDPAFYAWKCAFNAKNGPIQSRTPNSKEWIESTGKDAHSRQNIHIAAGFFMDLDGKLYTRKALVTVLGCTHRAALAFTANWERRMNRAVYDKWHVRFKWIPNTPENDKMYNFERNVITGCYTKKETHV